MFFPPIVLPRPLAFEKGKGEKGEQQSNPSVLCLWLRYRIGALEAARFFVVTKFKEILVRDFYEQKSIQLVTVSWVGGYRGLKPGTSNW